MLTSNEPARPFPSGLRPPIPGIILIAFFAVMAAVPSRSWSQSSATAGAPWRPSDASITHWTDYRPELNFRESAVPVNQLPPVLDPSDVESTDVENWHHRREHLLQSFRDHVYGDRPEGLETAVRERDPATVEIDGRTTTARRFDVTASLEDQNHTFPLTLFLPPTDADVGGAFPVVLHLNNRYRADVDDSETLTRQFFPLGDLLDAGFAAATVHTSDIDPDRPDGRVDGVRKLGDADWGSLSAWAWGASRVLDHLRTIDVVDGDRIALVGHSRGGKAALWASATDPRFAAVYANGSGCGGAAISRRRYGETVAVITKNFPHWFTPRFADYADRESDLPIDQHQLIALSAPRPVYIGSATNDLWADPIGEYTSLVRAAPAYAVFGHDTITATEPPPPGHLRVRGPTAYRLRRGDHDLTRDDWKAFLGFYRAVIGEGAERAR